MKNDINCLLIFLFTTIQVNGQTLQGHGLAGYTGLGAYSLHHVDVFSFTANPAALAQLKNSSAGIYAERKFLLSELNAYTMMAGLITSSGNFGLKAGLNGFSDYGETQLGLAYARKLGSKANAGIQFNYQLIRIAGYGNTAAISFEAGTILHLTDQLHVGVYINNPVGGKFGKNKQEKLPLVYAFGMGYDASAKFLVSAEIEKVEDRSVNVNAGLQYRFIPQVVAKIGLSSATSSVWLGFGLVFGSFRLDMMAAYHPQLGVTPGLAMLFNFNNKEK